jgi:hypothetical protein
MNKKKPTSRTHPTEMTPAQLAAHASKLLTPAGRRKFKALAPGEWDAMKSAAQTAKRKRGRPKLPVGQKATSVLISIDPALLAVADDLARRRDLSRSALVGDLIRREIDRAATSTSP